MLIKTILWSFGSKFQNSVDNLHANIIIMFFGKICIFISKSWLPRGNLLLVKLLTVVICPLKGGIVGIRTRTGQRKLKVPPMSFTVNPIDFSRSFNKQEAIRLYWSDLMAFYDCLTRQWFLPIHVNLDVVHIIENMGIEKHHSAILLR